MNGEDILRLNEKPEVDDSIKSYEYVEYNPIVGTQLNSAGVITITIENHDEFVHPHSSGLLIEGKLVKAADDTVYADADNISLTNNGLAFLFSNIKYSLSGQEIESVNNPGQASTILSMLKYSPDFARGPGLAQCWTPDTSTAAEEANLGFKARHDLIIEQSDPKGTFSFIVPLEHIFGFCEDYNKAMYGFRHTLHFVRKSDNDAIFRANGVGAGKCVLTKLSWLMARVQPNDIRKVALYKQIAENNSFEAAFRQRQCDTFTVPQTTETSWRVGVRTAPEKPCYIVIGLQTGKTDNQEQNPATFNHCNVKNMYVVLNTTRYPEMDMLTDFTKMQYTQAYKSFDDFASKYYGIDKLVTNSTVNPSTFKTLYPLFVFDVSKQSERLTHGIVDMTVKMQFHQNCAANTQAFAFVVSNRMLNMRSDGQKMDIIY